MMTKTISRFVMTLLLLTVVTVSAVGKEIKILAIGNSFSQDAIEQNLHELAAAEGIQTIVANMYIGGCSIERHVNNARANMPDYFYRKIGLDGVRREQAHKALAEALTDEDWDYVSVQQVSSLSGLPDSYAQLPELLAYVKKYVGKHTRLIFHQTWAYAQNSTHTGFNHYGRSQQCMYDAIVRTSRQIVKHYHLQLLVPCGTAIQNMRTSFVGDHLCRDGYHLQLTYGRYTAACTWFEALFGRSIVGNKYIPKGLHTDLARIAQQAAHAAVVCPDAVTSLHDYQLHSVLYKDSTLDAGLRAADLVSRMTLEEKVLQLNQYTLGRNENVNNIGAAVKNIPAEIGSLIYFGTDADLRNAMQRKAMQTRLGIPILFAFDVIHGFRTIFPIPLAQACSWNPQLVRLACGEAARETKRSGIDWTFAPMIDVSRDPRWGRIAESFGEDPYVNGIFGSASVRGYQGRYGLTPDGIAACLKHYVGYGASEAGRDYVYTEISRQSLWDTYLPPFHEAIKAGAITVMSSFNNISGTPSSANNYTLTEVLRHRFQFSGPVVSDWGAVTQLQNQGMAATLQGASALAIKAGVDIDMMSHGYDAYLKQLVESGKVDTMVVDRSVERILYVKFLLGLFEHPYTPASKEQERFFQPSAMNTAAQLAEESMVLLKNSNNVLPLNKHQRIAVIGPLAKDGDDLLGCWAAHGLATDVHQLYDGIQQEWGDKSMVRYTHGCDFEGDNRSDFKEAEKVARWADVVVVCFGEKREWTGENNSRASITLPAVQVELLKALRQTGKPIVMVLSNGRPVQLDAAEPLADAILEIWQPGVNGASAMAGILSGRINPSGRLSVTFPYTLGQVPIYYGRHKSARRGTQGLYKDQSSEPLYGFGHGLSYTNYSLGEIRATATTVKRGDKLRVTIPVTNTGNRDGMQTVFWYISDPYCMITRPEKELKFFEKKLIATGKTEEYTFDIDVDRDMSFIDANGNPYLEDGEFVIMANDKTLKIKLIK